MARTRTDTITIDTTPGASDALPGFHGLVGRSAPMQALFEQIRRVALYDVPVLIVGETGTGKTRVPRVLHELSPRRAGPFAVLHCGALPPDLLWRGLDAPELESSPGPRDRDADLLDEVRGGTLLLEGLGELAPDGQARLGRLVRRLARLPAGADVRLVSTTPRDLQAVVDAGDFRADLYYTLRGTILVVPPLRARLEDLPLLVEHVRRTGNARHGVAIEGVTVGALDRLATHPWPGNVLELATVLEAAMVLQGEGWLDADALALDPARLVPWIFAQSGPEDRGVRTQARQTIALDLAARANGVATRELAQAARTGLALARRELGALVAQGRLRRVGHGRAVHYVAR
jgi:DNA-binding NtrC family response regulator